MKPPCHPVLEPLRALNRLWTDEARNFYLFFAAPIDDMQFGFLQMKNQSLATPYWETFRIEYVDGSFLKCFMSSRDRVLGEYNLKITNNVSETQFVFENDKNEREKKIIFTHIPSSQKLLLKVEGLRDGNAHMQCWTALAE